MYVYDGAEDEMGWDGMGWDDGWDGGRMCRVCDGAVDGSTVFVWICDKAGFILYKRNYSRSLDASG